MMMDILHKAQKLGEHIPGFAGYGAADFLKTDILLRRYLAGEIEKVLDRLSDLIAARKYGGELGQKASDSLRTVTYLREEVQAAKNGGEGLSSSDEERLLDFDLVLLEKVAGLHTPLDAMEAAGDSEAEAAALDLFDEGLAEADDLFRLRRRVLLGEGGGR